MSMKTREDLIKKIDKLMSRYKHESRYALEESGYLQATIDIINLIKESPAEMPGECFSKEDIDNAYKQGFKEGNQRDFTPFK